MATNGTTMPKLHEVVNDTTHRGFCGPRAICTITGVPLSRAEYMIRFCRKGWRLDRSGKKRPIKGTYNGEVIKVLKRLGCKVEHFPTMTKTLGQFNEDTKHMNAVFLVNVTDHYTVLSQGICNDRTLGRPATRLHRVWKVQAPAEPKYGARTPRPRTKPPVDIKEVRYTRILSRIKTWESKAKRAENALKKLRKTKAYYDRKEA